MFDEAQDYHLFQALGMASLVDAAIFLQDKQQTFQRTDAGVMDREQNYWASLFGAYSNILEAPRSTLQNTSNIASGGPTIHARDLPTSSGVRSASESASSSP